MAPILPAWEGRVPELRAALGPYGPTTRRYPKLEALPRAPLDAALDVVFLEELADGRADVHAGCGHRPSSLTVLSLRMAAAIYVSGISTANSHHVLGR